MCSAINDYFYDSPLPVKDSESLAQYYGAEATRSLAYIFMKIRYSTVDPRFSFDVVQLDSGSHDTRDAPRS